MVFIVVVVYTNIFGIFFIYFVNPVFYCFIFIAKLIYFYFIISKAPHKALFHIIFELLDLLKYLIKASSLTINLFFVILHEFAPLYSYKV